MANRLVHYARDSMGGPGGIWWTVCKPTLVYGSLREMAATRTRHTKDSARVTCPRCLDRLSLETYVKLTGAWCSCACGVNVWDLQGAPCHNCGEIRQVIGWDYS